MSSLTVLVLPAWYPTAAQPLSGPFVRDHARAAAAQGHRVVILVDEGPRESVRGFFSLAEEQDGALRVFRLAHRPSTVRFSYLLGALTVARRLRKEGTPVDVLHAHVHRMGWPAVLAGKLLRRPVVITEHSTEWPLGTISPEAVRRARFAFPRAALVCPVNERLQRAIEEHGVRARFRIVPNAVDTSIFRPLDGSPRAAPTRLVNVALHVERKGLDILLRSFAELVDRRPELTLELIGDGPIKPDLERLAGELGMSERVRFPGAAEPREVAERLRAADLFVLSSLGENMPLVVLEALCCGLPVAATDVGGVPEAIGDDGALTRPGDADGLAAAIETVLDGYARFDRDDIARRAANRWSFDAVGHTWDEIYRSL